MGLMKRWTQATLITAGCVAVYFGMRSLPVEKCEFLHYGDYVNAEGVIEGCGYEETEFFNMREIRFPVIAELIPLSDPVPGEPVRFTLTLFTTSGKPIEWNQIAVSHTERIHAMVVDPSLNDYQHIHPQPVGPPGHYAFEMTPRRKGRYAVYLDFISLITSRRTLLETGFTVEGVPEFAIPDKSLRHEDGNLRFAFIPQNRHLNAGEELRFRLQVETSDDSEARFSPVMDSYAHMVVFDAEGTGFAHLHPLNPFIEGQDPLNPDLEFAFLFDRPGHYRVWAQVIVNGREVFAPFDLLIGEAA